MRNLWMMMTMLSVWALPVRAEQNEEQSATIMQDSPRPVMALHVRQADRTDARDYAPVHSTHNEGRSALRKLGPVPRVYLTAEQIAEAVREAEAGASGDVLIVDCNGNFDHDTIQGAIDAASDGDIIMVLPNTCTEDGHYFENINLLGKAVTLRSTDPSDPAVVAATVIDANGSGTVIKCISGERPDTIIDGFTITGGKADGSPAGNRGGGMYNNASSPTVTNCVFTANSVPGGTNPSGGGMANDSSSPTVSNCSFTSNSAGWGGGMYNNAGSPTVTSCTFSENTGSFRGGGMCNLSGSSPTLINCTFSGNSVTSGNGGGLCNLVASSPTVTNCTFTANTAVFGGGMFNAGNSDPTVTNCTFIGNILSSPHLITLGGGMFNRSGSSPTLTNCMFIGNEADRGAGLRNSSQNGPTLTNCAFVGNSAAHNGGGISDCAGTSELTNCILWGNSPNQFAEGCEVFPMARYSDVQGGWPGEGNIDADPLFVDPDGPDDDPDTIDDNDYRLAAGSPCIDAGDSTAVPFCILDLDGTERLVDDPGTSDSGFGGPPVVDMGAYEFGGYPLPDCTGNALADECEPDCNENGVADSCDLADGTSEDCNTNEVPDECEPQSDCNDNGVQDICDVAAGNSEDCDANGVPDECEQTDNDGDGVADNCDNCNLFNPDQADCQPNGIGDVCDLADGTSEDCDDDGMPDECGLDCNGNGFADSCDIADGTSADCNDNDIPDDCELDCNGNGVADSCDIADGTSEDCNDDGVPDECGPPTPEITQQPVSQEVEVGELVAFAISANGLGLEYQWHKNGAELVDDGRIFGSQGALLIILEAESTDAGEYHCVITDVLDCIMASDSATLTVTCMADPSDDGRVTICHMPPGNPENTHTIRVRLNAAPAHLAHGDHCGPCD